MTEKMRVLKVSEAARLHIEELKKLLAGTPSGAFALNADSTDPCGAQCRVTCAHYCKSVCEVSCTSDCQASKAWDKYKACGMAMIFLL